MEFDAHLCERKEDWMASWEEVFVFCWQTEEHKAALGSEGQCVEWLPPENRTASDKDRQSPICL